MRARGAPEGSKLSSSEAPAAPAAPGKSKKLLIILVVVVLLVVVLGAGAFILLAKRNSGGEEGGSKKEHAVQTIDPKAIPTFLPMDNMVVNLADPGGDRFAQVGITLELADEKTAELVKKYMPSIRSAVLLLLSQRTTDELLTREGKEKLAVDIRRAVSQPLGFKVPKPRKRKAKDEQDEEDDDKDAAPPVDNNPVRKVLFSSFIIQ